MTLSVDIRMALGDFELAVAFDAPPGVTALFGRSGAGKTSVLRAVAGLVTPQAGRIAVGDTPLFEAGRTNLPVHRRRLGYVFQESRLFPHLTVAENLAYAARVQRRGLSDLDRVVDLLGIGALLQRRPASLSGGEAQRVAIGRALLADPRLLLMDEPLAALDAPRKAEILPYLERLHVETALPILYVSHTLSEVARLATQMVVLERGRVMRAGRTEDVLSDPDIVPLLGVREAGAVIPARITAQPGDGVTELAVSGGRLFLPEHGAPVGTALRVRILAQDVMLALDEPHGLSALNVLPSRIEALRRGGGGGVIVQLRAGEDLLLARITQRSADALALRPGLPVWAVLKTVAVAQGDVGAGP
ncbi:molybdenum ABC transporter ATP-binding protein [Thalassococcus sp. CAU 1522]|uniref:Molybdenum ABC transporter ATP-binding protein n=1 Tax=Thalassococcus arenae TaxID=2851652 RepID=A0ABS6N7W4_9RHOB|nr:molybdenum ABC transporter ATP-binding protein [Thalassococcus arenae]MBV2360109.1 molybdenum ABC transporter ATP-binding protein [Thalassococcus arenae]